ncbi:MAG: IS256 family transposase [Burkholderia sp.]
MNKTTKEANRSKAETKSVLDEMIEQGARQIIQQAVEAELAAMLEHYSNVKSADGRRAVVRNGYLPEREIVTAVGPVQVKVPKVRDRSGSGIHFNSAVVPPYVRKSARVSAALPWLYLRGISTGDMSEALGIIILGGEAAGMSPNTVGRLKAQWADEQWNLLDLSSARWAYWWADGIHTGVRSDDSDGQCLLVIIGVTSEGDKEHVAIGDGYRESKESWCDLLLDLKKHGLQARPFLARSDGTMGSWAAMKEVFSQTKYQRCWFHNMSNVLNALPKSQQSRAKKALQDIWMAATRADALWSGSTTLWIATRLSTPKLAEKLIDVRDELLAFYDFHAEHWQHLRTMNPIELTFATVRHRTKRTRNCVSSVPFLGQAFKLIKSAEESWRKICAPERLTGMPFKDGLPVTDSTPVQQPPAA